MKETKKKQADDILTILDNVTVSCEECPLEEPCNIYKVNKKKTICGILTKISEGEQE